MTRKRATWRDFCDATITIGRRRRYEEATLLAGTARLVLASARADGLRPVSKVNSQFTGEQAWQILHGGVASLKNDEPIPPPTAKNIIREYWPQAKRIAAERALGGMS